MKALRPSSWVAAYLLLTCMAWAEDRLTAFTSPLVSYQFPQEHAREALTTEGAMTPVVSCQYLEWPEGLMSRERFSSLASYLYLPLSEHSAMLRGRVIRPDGGPVAGASVSLSFGTARVAYTSSDANGLFAVAVPDGACAVSVRAPGYAERVELLTVAVATVQHMFLLHPLPERPRLEHSISTMPVMPQEVAKSDLKTFAGAAFVPLTSANRLRPDRMTIVLTHG